MIVGDFAAVVRKMGAVWRSDNFVETKLRYAQRSCLEIEIVASVCTRASSTNANVVVLSGALLMGVFEAAVVTCLVPPSAPPVQPLFYKWRDAVEFQRAW